MSDQPVSSALLALSRELVRLIRDVAPSLVSIQSGHTRSTGFSWRPGLIVAAEDALPDDGELSILAHDGASSSAQIVGCDPSTDVARCRSNRADLPKAPPAAAATAAGRPALVAGAREGAANAALGVVSFVGPQWRSLRGGLIDARIELDATLARASEGGLALDAAGQALGMAVFGPRRRTLVIPMATIDCVADVHREQGEIARVLSSALACSPVKLDRRRDRGDGDQRRRQGTRRGREASRQTATTFVGLER